MTEKLEVLLIPLDDRPVTYLLPKQIAEINHNVSLTLPPRDIIGGLTKDTDLDLLANFLKIYLSATKPDVIVLSLDTLAYGGLIPSRRSNELHSGIIERLNKFKNLILDYSIAKPVIYAFSSVMRISNNNINEEEKEYWSSFGEKIYRYSYLSHKVIDDPSVNNELQEIKSLIPVDILEDYLATRERNFNINTFYLNWIKEGFLDYLVFSKDDTGEFGLNVREASQLKSLVEAETIQQKVCIQTGADEIPCDLVIRSIVKAFDQNISVYPVFSTQNGPKIVSRYEDRTISESVVQQLKLCGASISTDIDSVDMLMLVNTPIEVQGDHCMRFYPERSDENACDTLLNIIKSEQKPIMLADVTYANGADNLFTKKLLNLKIDLSNIFAYSAWNTTGNTLGSCAAMGISRYIAEKQHSFDKNAFSKLLLIRFIDDWFYQSIVRQKIRAYISEADVSILKDEMQTVTVNLAARFAVDTSMVKFSFPWDRTFEVEITL